MSRRFRKPTMLSLLCHYLGARKETRLQNKRVGARLIAVGYRNVCNTCSIGLMRSLRIDRGSHAAIIRNRIRRTRVRGRGMKFSIGQPMRRHEDLRLITGRGCYTDDIMLPRMTHAFVLRSPVAHAHIKRIEVAAARPMPGVLLVATGEDVRSDGLGDVPCMVPLVNRDGTPRHDTPRPVLALGKVRHVGQPVALVVAETLTAARDAAEAIEVEYDPLPAITEAKDAISPGAPQLFDHISSNIVFDWDNDMGDAKPTDAAFSRAARLVTLELVQHRLD